MKAAVTAREGSSPREGAATAMTAVPAMSWERMLMKVPTQLSREAVSPARGPNSPEMMPIRVALPECRQGPAKPRARTRQASPPPRVNHQADIP